MGMKTITATEYRCSNPECLTVHITPKDDPPVGFAGRVTATYETAGGFSTEWWACKAECIEPAVLGALDEVK